MTPPAPDQTMLLSLLGAGFATAFLHAALPTHWLPFALVGRAQRWSANQVLAVVAVAGLAHVAVTAAVGSLIVMAVVMMIVSVAVGVVQVLGRHPQSFKGDTGRREGRSRSGPGPAPRPRTAPSARA